MELQNRLLTFNYVALIICIVGIFANVLWISVYLTAYRIHVKMPRYPAIMDLIVAMQSVTDWIMCIVAAIFNLWMIVHNSNPDDQTIEYKFMINLKSSTMWITYIGSLAMLVVIARVSHNVLVSKVCASTSELVIKPTVFLLFISFALGFASLWFPNEPGPSHIYACNDTSDQSFRGIFSSLVIICDLVANGVAIVYYYYNIIKYTITNTRVISAVANSESREQATTEIKPKTNLTLLILFEKCTGLNLNRIAVFGIIMTLAYLISFSVVMVKVSFEIICGKRINLWVDFFAVIMMYVYSSLVNGLTVCNASATYQQILKSYLMCNCEACAVQTDLDNLEPAVAVRAVFVKHIQPNKCHSSDDHNASHNSTSSQSSISDKISIVSRAYS